MPLEEIEKDIGEPGGSPFRHAIYRNVWIANLAANFGSLIQSVGAAWLMATITPSADMVALVQTSVTLPIMLFSLAAGALADNFDRRKLMIYAQVFLFGVSAILAFMAWRGGLNPWTLLFFTFLIGVGTAFNGPAWQSLVGEMVPRTEIPAAIALNSMNFNIARSVGPALGGMIVAAWGAFSAFLINALSNVGLIVVLSRWSLPVTHRALPPEPLLGAMAAGLRYVAMSPVILTVLLRSTLFGIGAAGVQSLLPLVARDLVGGGALTYGVLFGAFGLGAVGGAMASGPVRARWSIETIVRLSFLGFGVGAVIAAFSPTIVVTAPALALAGGCWVLAMSSFNTTVQLSSPRWVVGRAVAIYQMATFGGMALGGWLWGELAQEHSIVTSLLISAGVLAIGALLGLYFRFPDLQRTNLDPLNTWQAPEVQVDMQPRSGPIVIAVEYTIRPEDTLAFLSVMAERKRIRMRDGARRWTLLRDIENAELWMERYHLPTWHDYIRHNQRMTVADVGVRERLRALDHSAGAPKVHRMIERQVGWTTMDTLDRSHGPHDHH